MQTLPFLLARRVAVTSFGFQLLTCTYMYVLSACRISAQNVPSFSLDVHLRGYFYLDFSVSCRLFLKFYSTLLLYRAARQCCTMSGHGCSKAD